MPQTGMLVGSGQTVAPVNSSLAMDEIPSRKLYIQNNGQPLGQMNSDSLNSSANFDFGSQASGAGNQMQVLTDSIGAIASQIQQQSQNSSQMIQESSNRTASSFDDTNTRIGNVMDGVTGVQTSIDANQEANMSLYGFQTIPNATELTWNWSTSQNYFSTSVDILNNAGFAGAVVLSQQLLRLQSSVNFLVWYVYAEQSQGFYDVEWLNDARPQNKPRNQSVLAYLQSVYPGYPWEENHDGTGLVGMSWTSTTDGFPRSYYWAPECPSLDDIYHLWDYTPSSGGPVRNGIDDFLQIVTLLPIKY